MEQTDKNESVIRQLSAALSIGYDEFATYLWIIDAPPSLEGLLQVSAQFNKIIEYIICVYRIEEPSEFIDEDQISACGMVAATITKHSVEIESIHPCSNIKLIDKEPYYGLFTKWYIYSCLGISHLQGQNSRRHHLLEAYMVIASAILRHRREEHCNPKEYRSALDTACRLARKLLINHKIDSHNNLPQQLSVNRGDYLKCIERAGELLEPIYKFLDYAFSDKRAPTYVKSGSYRKTRITRHSINDAADPELIGKVDRDTTANRPEGEQDRCAGTHGGCRLY